MHNVLFPLSQKVSGQRKIYLPSELCGKIIFFVCACLRVSGTPRGVYISVGEIPTRQLTVRAVVKGTVSSVGGHKS